jgi:glycosyltransferase involved in cell wall biosynthesis
MAAEIVPVMEAAPWPLHDYTSPGLRVIRPDAAFPHLVAGDALHHPWKYLRRDVPHVWYCDERFPLMGFLNRDEAVLLHNIALQFEGKPALEIGSWLGWSTCHLALGGVVLDVVDPAHEDPLIRASVEESLARCGVADRVNLVRGRSPESIAQLGRRWNLFFIDGEHEGAGPLRDAMACLPYAADDCAFVFHDLASPAVAAGLRFLAEKGFEVVVYQTAQIMAMAWRGDVTPVAHVPDPAVAWQMPPHLIGLPVSGVDFAPARGAIRQLREVFADDPTNTAPPSVCLVTSELVGPFKNGGIGTANTGLAELLVSAGMRVTVLYTGAVWTHVPIGSWKEHYAERGIELHALSIAETKHLAGPVAAHSYVVPWLVHRYLTASRFDVVHFNDCCGEGSLALAAKRLGLGFADTLLVVGLHSPSRWVIDANHTLAATPVLAAFDYAERLSVSSADVLWSPSRYLLDWAAERGFQLPEQTFVQQYAMPSGTGAPREIGHDERRPLKELVFFGRLEERKGLRVFCNAIHNLRDELASHGIAVTFLGKPERCAGMDSLEYIGRRAKSWTFPVKTITNFGQPQALAYLQRDGVLAVMPSPLDNSPCTVYEALAAGIPFLAARTGGIPELIARGDQERVLFEYGTDGLTNALRDVIARGGAVASHAVAPEETRRAWQAMHVRWRELLPAREAPVPRPRTLAAIIDHRSGAALNVTVNSLSLCPSLQRFIVLNRSGESFPLPTIDLTTTDVDAVAADVAGVTEDIVLLIHSGVAVIPEALEMLVRAIDSDTVDGVQPACRVTTAGLPDIIPPLGGSVPFSLYEGVTFTGGIAIRREVLVAAQQARSYVADAPFMGLADFCVTHGARILPYPEVVLERAIVQRVDSKSSAPARIAAYENVSENDRYYMLASGYAASDGRGVPTKRELARFAANAGFSFAVRLGAAARRRMRRWMSLSGPG